MKVFGFEFGGKNKAKQKVRPDDFIKRLDDEDAVVVYAQGDTILHTQNFAVAFENERQQIETYRRLAQTVYVDSAVDDIVDEAVDFDKFSGTTVKLSLDNTSFPANVKKKILEEFEKVLDLLSYTKDADDLFREWYVDGRHYFYLVPHDTTSEGIKEIRKLDPRYVKRIKKIFYDSNRAMAENIWNPRSEISYVFLPPSKTEHELSWSGSYVNMPDGQQVVEINEEAIAYSDSGRYDVAGHVIGNLEKAIKPFNQLSMLEDATVIHRIARGPMRRVWYIDVGDLPKGKAEEYMRGLIQQHKSKMMYDTNTGLMAEQYEVRNMMEDIWLPRRNGQATTSVENMDGAPNLGQIDDIMYHRQRLYKALKIPISRLQSETMFNIGRTAEITRDEVKFSKYVKRLNRQFSELFFDVLKKQLVLRKVLTPEEWIAERNKVDFLFSTNSFFAELKELEMLQEKIDHLEKVDPFVGKYFSQEFAQTRALGFTVEDIERERKQIEKERELGLIPPLEHVDARLNDEDPPQPDDNVGYRDAYPDPKEADAIADAEDEEHADIADADAAITKGAKTPDVDNLDVEDD